MKRINNILSVRSGYNTVTFEKLKNSYEITVYNKNNVAIRQITYYNRYIFRAYRCFKTWVDENGFKLIQGG